MINHTLLRVVAMPAPSPDGSRAKGSGDTQLVSSLSTAIPSKSIGAL